MFRAVDVDNSGKISFKELLRERFPHATPKEMAMMIEWGKRKAVPLPPRPRLSESQVSPWCKKYAIDRALRLSRPRTDDGNAKGVRHAGF